MNNIVKAVRKRGGAVWLLALVALGVSLVVGLGLLGAESSQAVSLADKPVPEALELLGVQPDDTLPLDRLTAYHAVVSQTDASPAVASCGESLPNQMALSRDYFFDDAGEKHLCGAEVMVLVIDPETYTVLSAQERVVWDTMDERFAKTGDLLVRADRVDADEWGVKEGIVVFMD